MSKERKTAFLKSTVIAAKVCQGLPEAKVKSKKRRITKGKFVNDLSVGT